MKLDNRCLECISDQTKRVCSLLEASPQKAHEIDLLAQQCMNEFDFQKSPPQNVVYLYESMASILGVDDLYSAFKTQSSEKARAFIPLCQSHINSAEDELFVATKTAVAGNVIDLAAVMLYDLEEELAKIYDTPFAIDDFNVLEATLKRTQNLVYLADNAGEEIFDKLYMKSIKKYFPQIKIYYFVRGKPIINDLTYLDALKSGIDELATIIDSGVPTPGLAQEFMSEESKIIFKKADCIISKGMGNYECLGEVKGLPIFFLFKVKCHVVAQAVGAQLGSIVCKKGL